jgi:hypothetical protein
MSVTEYENLKSRVDALGERLETRIREFETRGEFSSAHEVFTGDIRRRQAALKARADEAQRQGHSWQMAKADLEREFTGMTDDFRRWEERLEADAMKRAG